MLAVTSCLLAGAVHADLLDQLNQLRQNDCAPDGASRPRLQRSSGLDAVAQEWSKVGRLAEALDHVPYHTNKLASVQVQGTTRDADIAQALRDNYCGILADARYSEVGVYRRNADIWIVVAAPITFPASSEASRIQQKMLELVNVARSKARNCGAVRFRAAKPLRISVVLGKAALTHAQDMARNHFFMHQGSDGSTPGERVTRAGYKWNSVAENIAAGVTTAEDAMQGWLDSPGHCANIMQPQFAEMAVGYAFDPDSKAGIYWSQVFARPR